MKRNRKLDPIINQAVKACVKDGKLLDSQINKLMNVFKTRPQTEAIYLIANFLKGLKREVAKTTLIIESAIPLSPSGMKKLKQDFKGIVREEKLIINKKLLGGLRLKLGDEVYDYSITAKLNQLKEITHGR